ncbi:MAG: LicD family protein [Lachnospiraceae bacterium]|nr:LicD family protein [Lachnospiraceae bacterium]
MQELSFPPSFFEDEVREGFFVSGMMKRCWAAQLKTLAEIDRICRKHHITWYIETGTLLGAVRHRGFIPWDDDLDISMMREDLERFLDIAEGELAEGYTIGDVRRRDDYLNANMRIISTESIEEKTTRAFYGFPYSAGVDVFALDGVFADEAKERQRRSDIKEIQEFCGLFEEEEENRQQIDQGITLLEEKYAVKIPPEGNRLNAVLKLLIPLFSACSAEEAEDVILFFNWKDDYRLKKAWYADTVMLPFEHLLVPAPVGYQEALAARYRNVRYIGRGGAYHDYPYYTDMEEFYKGIIGHNPYRYTMTAEDLVKKR